MGVKVLFTTIPKRWHTAAAEITDGGWLINLGKRQNYMNRFVCIPKDDHQFIQLLAG
jgi:hypothetical protein